MFKSPAFSVDHWSLKETPLKLDLLPQSESVFALANGHLGWRGNLDEGEPHGIPGSYLNGLYEALPLPYPEGGYGYPEPGQTAINVTNGRVLRLLVGDEPFDLRYGRLHSHERTLDLRSGLLLRHCEWTSPAGSTVRVHSTRWSPSLSVRSRPSPTRWRPSTPRCASSSSRNSSPTNSFRRSRAIPAQRQS